MWDLVRYDDWYLKLLLSQEAISCPYYKFIKRLLCYNPTPPICYLCFTCCTCWEVSGCPEKSVYHLSLRNSSFRNTLYICFDDYQCKKAKGKLQLWLLSVADDCVGM